MKSTVLTLALMALLNVNGFAQKYFTRSANISFFSETPMESIDATNHQVTSVVDLEKSEMVFSVLMKSFEFEKALMQEHFNEKYVESDKFPKAQFKGTFTTSDPIDMSKDGEHKVKVSGSMNLHGVDKKVETEGTFTVKGGKLAGKAEFNLILTDYDISVPGVVKDNIAEEIKITVDATYEPYKK